MSAAAVALSPLQQAPQLQSHVGGYYSTNPVVGSAFGSYHPQIYAPTHSYSSFISPSSATPSSTFGLEPSKYSTAALAAYQLASASAEGNSSYSKGAFNETYQPLFAEMAVQAVQNANNPAQSTITAFQTPNHTMQSNCNYPSYFSSTN